MLKKILEMFLKFVKEILRKSQNISGSFKLNFCDYYKEILDEN